MVLVHNLYEIGQSAVEVLAEEPSAAPPATEAFREGAFAISTIYHSAVGFASGGTEGLGGVGGGGGGGGGEGEGAGRVPAYPAGGGTFGYGGPADFECPMGRASSGSYGYGGGEAAGGGGGFGGCAVGGRGQRWGEGSWFGGGGRQDGYGHNNVGEAEWGGDGQGRHGCGGGRTGDEAWGGGFSRRTVDRRGGDAVSEEVAEGGAGEENGYDNLQRDSYNVIGHHQRFFPAEQATSGDGVVEGLGAQTNATEAPAQDSGDAAAIQAILARQCVNTPGFYDRILEATSAEQLQDDNSSLMSSDDEEGGLGVGSLSGFSLRRNEEGRSFPTRRSRVMTALDVMNLMNEQEQHHAHSQHDANTSKHSHQIGGLPANGNAQGIDEAGVGVDAASSAGKASNGEWADKTFPRAFLGEARAMQLDGRVPAAPAPTAWLESEPAPYLSLDSIEEPKTEPPAFEEAFDFPFLYGRKAGSDKSGGDAIAGDVAYGVYEFLDNDDEDEEVDEAALALAADSLLGYDTPASESKSRGHEVVSGAGDVSCGCDNNDDALDGEEIESPSVDAATAPSGVAIAIANGYLPGGSVGVSDKLLGIGGDRKAAAAAAIGGVSPALVNRRFHRASNFSSRAFSTLRPQPQLPGGDQDNESTSDESIDDTGVTSGSDAAAAVPPALGAVESSFADEDPAAGPMSLGGGECVWSAIGIYDGDGGGGRGVGGGSAGETAGGGQTAPGGCGGLKVEQFANAHRLAESLDKIILKIEATGGDQECRTVHPPVEQQESNESVSESHLHTIGGGNGSGDVIHGPLGFPGRRDERGLQGGLSHGAVRGRGGSAHLYSSSGLDNVDDSDTANGDNDHDDGGAHLARTAADVDALREFEAISVGPVAPAGSATALQASEDGIEEEDVGPRCRLGAVHVAGVASAAGLSAWGTTDDFEGRVRLAGLPEQPRQDGAGHETGARQGDNEGARASEEDVHGVSSTSEDGERAIEAAGGSFEMSYDQGIQPSAPLISSVVGSSEVGDDVDRVGGGKIDATDAVPTTPSPLPTSWLDRLIHAPGLGVLRRCLAYSEAAVGHPESSAPIINSDDAEQRGFVASTASGRRGMQLSAGSRAPPTVFPFQGNFNERVEDRRVREGHRRSR